MVRKLLAMLMDKRLINDKKEDGTGEYISGHMNDFTFDGKDFTIEISGLKVPRKDITAKDEWLNIKIIRNANITTFHSQERIDDILYHIIKERDVLGIRRKQYTRADLIKG